MKDPRHKKRTTRARDAINIFTLGTGYHAEYTRLPISVALLPLFLLLCPHYVEEELRYSD